MVRPPVEKVNPAPVEADSNHEVPEIAERLFAHALDRAERYAALSPVVLAPALETNDPAVRLARHLFECSEAIQGVNHIRAGRCLSQATRLLPRVSQPRLRSWYFDTQGVIAAAAQDYDAARTAFESAIAITEAEPTLERDRERSCVNLLFALCSAGRGEDVASTLLGYLRQKESTALSPAFYRVTSYVLHWLGEYEFSYRLLYQSVEVLEPSDGRLARDWRGLARTLTELGRLDDAQRYLNMALTWIDDATRNDALATHVAAVILAVAKDNLDSARHHLESIDELAPISYRHAPAYFRVATALQTHGDYEASAALLERFNDVPISPEFEPTYSALAAEVAMSRGDADAALRLFEAATRLAQSRPARADTQAMICAQLEPWLNVADPSSVVPPALEVPRDYRSRWLTATARDMRRSVAPSRLAPQTKASQSTKIAALRLTIEELRLMSEFLADAALNPDIRPKDDFWALHSTLEYILGRRGATLSTNPEVGEPVELATPGLAGRLAFGTIAVVAEHSRPGTTVSLRVMDSSIRVRAEGLVQHSVDRLLADVKHLRSQYRTTDRVAAFAAFLATYLLAASQGWTVSARSPSEGTIVIDVEAHNDHGSSVAELPSDRHADPSRALGNDTPRPPNAAPRIVEALREFHERRFDYPTFDVSLIDEARTVGDVDLLASALLIGSCAELLSDNFDNAEALLTELGTLIDAHPRLEREIWPNPVFLANRRFSLSDALGNHQQRWIHAARALIEDARNDAPDFRTVAAYNWCEAEIDRGGLSSAWRFAAMCDRTGTSAQGRSYELGVHTQILLIEERFAAANVVATERAALERAAGAKPLGDTRGLQAVALAKIGRFSDAHRVIAEIEQENFSFGTTGIEAVRALVLFDEGRFDEAYTACIRARDRTSDRYATATLTTTVPIEAAILVERGHPEKAADVLSEFALERHQRFDLPLRLEVEGAVAAALGNRPQQVDIARHRFALAYGYPRWDVRRLALFNEFWKAMEQATQRDREQLEAELGVVAAVVTNDLNNALDDATFAVEVAEQKVDDEVLRRVERAFEAICTVADQLDELARSDGVSSALDKTPVDLGALLGSLQFPNQEIYGGQGGTIRVTNELPDGLLVPIPANLVELMVTNLVGNAIKHGRVGGQVRIAATYTPLATDNQGCVTVAVEDDGPGIPRRQAQRLRCPEPDPHSAESGLGLWVVQRYAGVLGFGVEVGTSELGGARVAIHMPLDAPSTHHPDAPADYGGPNDGPSRRVLVVEDDALLAMFLVEALHEAKKDVWVASTASQALERLDSEEFDVILADIELADGSTGFDVLAGVEDRGLEPFIVIMTGQASHQTRVEMTRRFGKAFTTLQKPFTLAALTGAIG